MDPGQKKKAKKPRKPILIQPEREGEKVFAAAEELLKSNQDFLERLDNHLPNIPLTNPNWVYILLIMNDLSEHDRIARLARTCANLNLRRATRAVSNYYDQVFLAACGLRATQIPPLVVLYMAGPRSIQEIAAKLDLDRTTLSRNLKPLEEAGLVEIAPGEDLRTRMVTLTERGREALLRVLPAWEDAQAHVVEGLSEERFSALLAQLSDIAELTREA